MNQKASLALFLLACLVPLLHYFTSFYGYFGYDDLYYAELAVELFWGEVDYADHYTYRIIPLFFTGLSYQLLGVSDLASALPTLLITVGIFYLLYRQFREKPWLLLVVYGLYFSLSWNLFYADKPMPDPYVSGFSLVAWLAYVVGARRDAEKQSLAYGIVSAFGLFLAFNSKGTVILLAPLFLVYFLKDMAAIRQSWESTAARRRYWSGCVGATAMLLVGYGLVCYALTGNALARFAAIEGNHYLNPCSYDQGSWANLFERLTTGFVGLMLETRLYYHGLIALVVLLAYKLRKRGITKSTVFYAGTIFLSLGTMNFMTISTGSYNPVCLDSRHLLLFSPILAVCSGRLLEALVPHDFGGKGSSAIVIGLVAAIALGYPSWKFAAYSRSLNYPTVKASYQELIRDIEPSATIYGSDVVKNYGRYYTGFSTVRSRYPRFATYRDLPDCPVANPAAAPAYLLTNWYMDWHDSAPDGERDSIIAAKGYHLLKTEIDLEELVVWRLACE